MAASKNHNFKVYNIWRFLLKTMANKTRMDLNLYKNAPQKYLDKC